MHKNMRIVNKNGEPKQVIYGKVHHDMTHITNYVKKAQQNMEKRLSFPHNVC